MSEPEFSPVGLVDQAALNFLKQKKLLPGFKYQDVWLHEHSVAFTVAKMMDKDLLAETQAAVCAVGFAPLNRRKPSKIIELRVRIAKRTAR